MLPAALGLRVHSGWAAVVALTGPSRAPAVIDRRRIEIADPAIPGSKQPFHAAEPWDLKKADKYIRRCTERTRLLARRALRTAVADLRGKGVRVIGCGVLLGSGRPIPGLAAILASHPLIHTAEGEFFRGAVVQAARHCRLPVTGIKERELWARATAGLRRPTAKLQRQVSELGESLGPPWTQDQKLAALVAWLALTATKPGRAYRKPR